MCYELYIASDRPLPIVPYNEKKRAFNVDELNIAFMIKWYYTNRLDELPILKYFTKPYLYYFGSDTGCG